MTVIVATKDLGQK